jgi:glycosyltransferase involved in cell wall biosynthesis
MRLRRLWLKFRYSCSSDWIDHFEGSVERFTDIKRCTFENKEIVVASGCWAGREIRRVNHNGIIKVHHVRGILKDDDGMREGFGENVPKIVVASYLEKVIERICGQKVYATIPNGMDTTEFYPSVPESQRNGVGTIYGIGYHKDPQTVLGVLRDLRISRPEIPQRIFSGHRKPRDIPRKIFHRLPPLEKIREIYSRSLVWFLGSASEGFPAPLLEAMACGCAVVSTDCGGGAPDIIEDGENGYLVKVGDVEQIVSRIQELLDNGELRQRFVANSKETLKNFTWENSINKLEKALKDIAESQI